MAPLGGVLIPDAPPNHCVMISGTPATKRQFPRNITFPGGHLTDVKMLEILKENTKIPNVSRELNGMILILYRR